MRISNDEKHPLISETLILYTPGGNVLYNATGLSPLLGPYQVLPLSSVNSLV